MVKADILFSEEDLACMKAELKQKGKRNVKIKEIYRQLFGTLSLTDKLAKFAKRKPWNDIIVDYFKANSELMTELGFESSINDIMDFGCYMNELFISELRYHFGFIKLDFNKLDLSGEGIELLEKSAVFWSITGLWLVTVNDTDYIVYEMSGRGGTFYFINTLDKFIVNRIRVKENLSDDVLNKFNKQFIEFALKHKKLKGNSNG